MKRLSRTVSTLVCLAALGLGAAAAEDAAQPQAAQPQPGQLAVVPEPVWDAGVVGRGEVVRHAFEVHNAGDVPLYLREVRAACGCTVASFDEVIPPGGVGKVTAEVTTEAFRGPIAKDLTVFTSDPTNPMLTLTVRAEIQPAVDALPGYFRFQHVQGEAPVVVEQRVWSTGLPDLAVLGVSSPLPQIAVSFRPATDAEREAGVAGRQWIVTATLASDAPTGPLTGDVVVRTSHPDQPELLLPIAGYVRPVVAASPPRLDFGAFGGGEPRRGSVIVTNYGSAPVTVLAAETDIAGLTAKVDTREEGKRYDVALTLAADLPKGPFSGVLRLRTDSPRSPVLEVPVRGEVR